MGSPNPADGDFQELAELGPAPDSGWHQVRVGLDDYATRDDVYVAFYYEGDNADQWTIDDVRLARPELTPASYTFSVTYQVPENAATCGAGQAAATCIPAQCATDPES